MELRKGGKNLFFFNSQKRYLKTEIPSSSFSKMRYTFYSEIFVKLDTTSQTENEEEKMNVKKKKSTTLLHCFVFYFFWWVGEF